MTDNRGLLLSPVEGDAKNCVFTGDGWRHHSRKDRGNHISNIEKIDSLFGAITHALGYTNNLLCSFQSDNPDWGGYFHNFFDTDGDAYRWAYRSQVLSPIVEAYYDRMIGAPDLIVAFEAPESLFEYASKRDLLLFDFSFHPYRYAEDYTLMARSTCPKRQAILDQIEVDWGGYAIHTENLTLNQHAVIRREVERCIPKGRDSLSLLMLQTRFDKSKFDGVGGIIDDLEVIRRLDFVPDFYRSHPVEQRGELEIELTRMGSQRLDIDARFYHLLKVAPDLIDYYSVSSGSIMEANYLGARSATMLSGQPWQVRHLEEFAHKGAPKTYRYTSVDKRIFTHGFWTALMNSDPESVPSNGGLNPGYLKKLWNAGWG